MVERGPIEASRQRPLHHECHGLAFSATLKSYGRNAKRVRLHRDLSACTRHPEATGNPYSRKLLLCPVHSVGR